MYIHNTNKKVAIINDFSGFGRCSLTVAMPIVSYLGVQACPVPTAIFSNHTGYDSFYCKDLTEDLTAYIGEWQKLDLHFDGISSGFLGSIYQIDTVIEFIKHFKGDDTKVVVDTVMGDNGKVYPTYTADMCKRLIDLLQYSDVITPNVTEACFLTDTPYKADGWTNTELLQIVNRLHQYGAKQVVISGILDGGNISNAVSCSPNSIEYVTRQRFGSTRSGTGDIFTAIVLADAVNGVPLYRSVERSADYIRRCIKVTEEYHVPPTDGVCFEEVLHTLPLR